MLTGPCKGCADRHTACHSYCERYLAFQAARKELRERQEAETRVRSVLFSVRRRWQRKEWE